MADSNGTTCRDHCRFAQHCDKKGWPDLDPEDCAMFYKLEELVWDAYCDMMDSRRREDPDYGWEDEE